MAREPAPDDIVSLADARAAARRARDWSTADELRVRIEAAGWKVIDVGTLYDLVRTAAPDVLEGDSVRYGASTSVPSRLDEPPSGVASVVLVATDWPEDTERAVLALAAHSPAGTQIVVVANGESPAQAASLASLEAGGPPAVDPGVAAADPGATAPNVTLEVLRTSVRLGFAAALNAGIRRATAPVIVLMDTSVEPQGHLVTPLVAALEDPMVAVAGPFGIVSADLRRFAAPAEGVVEVDAIEGYAMAFRRADYAARGPLDEHFVFYRHLDIWWSLVLRDQAGDDPDDAAPRRAVRVAEVPVIRHPHRGWASLPDEERERLSKKNFYRVLKLYASRRDLLVAAATGGPGAGGGG